MRDATSYAHPLITHTAEAEWAPRQFWVSSVPIESVIDNGLAPRSAAVPVYANHGRWIAECPDCRGAQLASRADHRFMCNLCANASVGGLWRPTIWRKDHAELGAMLDERPTHLANAGHGEQLNDVRRENKLLAEATPIGGNL